MPRIGGAGGRAFGGARITGEVELDVPTGTVVPFTATAIPSGYLLAGGQAESRSGYPALNALYAADNYPYGNGDGSTTFNVPNLAQRIPLGKAPSGTGSTLGETGGAIDHAHAGAAHTHPFTQPGGHDAHSNHVVTQPGAHSNHIVTQPTAHADVLNHVHVERAQGGTTGSTSGTHLMTSTATGGSLRSSAQSTLNPTSGGVASQAHAGTAVDAHSAHSGSAVDAHTAHSAHSGGAVLSDGTGAGGTGNPPFLTVLYIVKT